MRRDGSDARRVSVSSGEANAWSPVEDKLVFGDSGGIYLLVPETGESTCLIGQTDIESPAQTNPRPGKVAWSPDGQQLAFTWRAQTPDLATVQDGLWVIYAAGSAPMHLLAGDIPERGEMILHGWSGDGQYLIYWQAPILSASILADGVPLYALPVGGGEPVVIADVVLVHDDAVQVEPGSEQVALVAGGGRAVWTDKTLLLVLTPDAHDWHLSPAGQSAASPVWSPNGERMAYVGMPDATHEVVGGPPAQAALQQRRIWVLDMQTLEPISLSGSGDSTTGKSSYRDEAPQWVDNETLLFARLGDDGGVSLWTIGVDGTNLQQVVDEITPAPEWFGFYGYIDWSPLFAVWRPTQIQAVVAGQTMRLTPTRVPPLPTPDNGHALAGFLEELRSDLTSEEAIALWGEPDVVTGSGLIIYQYELDDGLRLWLGFPGTGPLSYAHLETANGRRFALTPVEEDKGSVGAEAAMTPTPTPASMDAVAATPYLG
jgi:hypothetical protein